MKFRAELQRTGGTTTGFQVADEIVAALGGGGRPKVVVRVNGYEFRSSIAKMGGEYWLGVSAERRAAAGVEGGQSYDLEVELDSAPRTVETPADLAAALDAEPEAKAFWEGLSVSNRRWHAEQLTSARTDETRARRLAKSLGLLRAGKAR
ncbi:YdeI/OmpD-associated family protein [Actinoplanes sp. DH11]|uniref:YdeI/OmpD-associated family protein n=1 Tax=Actinoplanes sp. DH11 TaxID=2857011 RepID=UPI001E4329A0|nr:YdeI/OmpD-associated family protein [Actinoplanes sp. DH11]